VAEGAQQDRLGELCRPRRRPEPCPAAALFAEGEDGAGAGSDVVRLSVGIEDVKDIIADLEQALSKI